MSSEHTSSGSSELAEVLETAARHGYRVTTVELGEMRVELVPAVPVSMKSPEQEFAEVVGIDPSNAAALELARRKIAEVQGLFEDEEDLVG